MSEETTTIEEEMKALQDTVKTVEVKRSKLRTTNVIALGNNDFKRSGVNAKGEEWATVKTPSQITIDNVLEDIEVCGIGSNAAEALADHGRVLAFAVSDKMKTIKVYENGSRHLSFDSSCIFVPRTATPEVFDKTAKAEQAAAPASL